MSKTAKEFKVEIERFKCDDAISRKDAEQMFRNIRSHLKPQDYKSAEEFNTRDLMLLNAEQMIHALPSVTQKSGKWIPVSERLPEVGKKILVTSYGRVCYAVMISTDGHDGYPIFRLQDSLKERTVCETIAHSDMTSNRIIAWMSLPESYQGE